MEEIRKYSLLYFDTDSVIFYRKLTDPLIPTGSYLGELVNEIEKNYGHGAKCTKFAALGPKNYAFEVLLPNGEIKCKIKIKGIALTKRALEIIKFINIFNMAISYPDEQVPTKLYVEQVQWNINKHSMIKTRTFNKEYKALSKKRIIKGNLTLPYGYIQDI